jgi:hypothetical protein
MRLRPSKSGVLSCSDVFEAGEEVAVRATDSVSTHELQDIAEFHSETVDLVAFKRPCMAMNSSSALGPFRGAAQRSRDQDFAGAQTRGAV